MTEKEKAIKTIKHLIKQADKRFEKARQIDNYSDMTVMDAYKSGLSQALHVVMLLKEN